MRTTPATVTTVVLLLFVCFTTLNAQVSNVLDGAYVPEASRTRRAIPYPHLREADVMYTKRVWREIDLTQKMNHPLYFPLQELRGRESMFQVIRDALLTEGSIDAWEAFGPTGPDDEFRYQMTRTRLDSVLKSKTTIEIRDTDDEVIGVREEFIPIPVDEITRYRIKEDWIFDRQRGERYVRIVGIAPIRIAEDQDGQPMAPELLFWLYFPQLRHVLANHEVYNTYNDGQRRTYDDVFQKRFFASYIIKESNVYDRYIQEYTTGLDALAEGQRIQNELFEIEHDLWHY